MSRKVTVGQAEKIITNSQGRFITVEFIKRTNNKLRKMNCQVRKPGKRSRKQKPGLVRVYDMVKKQYRIINISGLRSVKASGKEYIVK